MAKISRIGKGACPMNYEDGGHYFVKKNGKWICDLCGEEDSDGS
jgi:hypothetical protein